MPEFQCGNSRLKETDDGNHNHFYPQTQRAPAAALSVVIYLQTGTSGDVQNLRDDIRNTRGDIHVLHTEMAEGHQAIRTEMAESDRAIRADMSELTSIEQVFYADLEPPAP